MSETKKIGNKIAEARKRINISQAELAQRMFVSSQAVGKWERGESMPDITAFNRLADILGVDLNYFSEKFQSISEGQNSTLLKQSRVENEVSDEADTPYRNMSRLNLTDCDFSGLKNLNKKLSSSNMKDCKFKESEMADLLLKNNNIVGCDFSNSDMSRSKIQSSNLAGNTFAGCSLLNTQISGSYISGCDLDDADLTGVVFKNGGFENNTLNNTLFKRTIFKNSQIINTLFEGTIEECSFENCIFTKVVFKNASLLNTFFKNNRKLNKVQFIDCTVDRITYAFLKNNLADLSGVTLLP